MDLAAVDPETGNTSSISVKSVKKRNPFYLDPVSVRPEVVYVFVITNGAGQLPEFFVARGATLLTNEERVWGKWGRTYEPRAHRGIMPTVLTKFKWKNEWGAIEA